VLGISGGSGTTAPPGGTGETGGAVPSGVRDLLKQAEQKFAEAQKALQAGDLTGYAKAQDEARTLVAQALKAAGKAPAPSASPAPSSAASPTSPSASPSQASPSKSASPTG
jgi:hypothetical protein